VKLKKNSAILAIVLLVIIGITIFFFVMKPKINLASGGEIELQLIAGGFVSPVEITFPNDDSGRLFVVDRPGIVRLINSDGTIQEEPFLDITDRVVAISPGYDERGLLGMAFHPNFRNNGKFYVFYNAELRDEARDNWDSTIRVSEFNILEENKANPNSEKILLEVDHPQMNHDGGKVLFGKDEYLYISIGDGGNANDVGEGHNPEIGNGQDRFTLLGKILRIDVDNKTSLRQYGIPADNPFSDGKDGLKEIYAYGFRNPWGMSFDAETGELYVGDAGQNLWEEISRIEKGKNYGWNIKEGTHCFSTETPNESPEECGSIGYLGEELIAPVIEYPNAGQRGGFGRTNVGGVMYHGTAIPELVEKFIFGDWSTEFTKTDGTLFVAEPSSGLWEVKELKIKGRLNGRLGEAILSLGQDSENELYLLTTGKVGPNGDTGKVYKIISP